MSATGSQREWSLRRLLDHSGVRVLTPLFDRDALVSSLVVDSRDVKPGACFVAVRGSSDDGHRYVEKAFAAGAQAAIVEDDAPGSATRLIVRVEDTRTALARAASAFYGIDRAQREGRLQLVGVTGTNGKTTVCALVTSILRAAGMKTATLGTVRNDVIGEATASSMTTLPPIELCARLAQALDSGASHAVLEVSSHALDQRRCAGLEFNTAIFTNLTRDHLDYHRTLDAYARAKQRLFAALPSSACAVVNADDPRAAFMSEGCAARIIRYRLEDGDADASAEILGMSLAGSRLALRLGRDLVEVETRLVGRHNVQNILAAAAAAHHLGAPGEAIASGIASLKTVPGRLERVGADDQEFSAFVDYAHTPDALERVLGVLRGLTAGRVICVFGCGGDRDRGKRPMMGRTVAALADRAVVTSDNPRSEDPKRIIDQIIAGIDRRHCDGIVVEPDRRHAIEIAIQSAKPGDTVLVAGKGHEDYQIIGDRRLDFDDRIVVAELLAGSMGVPS